MDKYLSREDKVEFKEYLDRAMIIGRTSTSDLAGMIMQKMGKYIEEKVNESMEMVKMNIENQSRLLNEIRKEQTTVKEDLENTTTDYKVDKAKIWVSIGLTIFFGGTIITLSIMTINTKIKEFVEIGMADAVHNIVEGGFSSPELRGIIKQSVVESLKENVTKITEDE